MSSVTDPLATAHGALPVIDDVDRALLRELATDGRAPWALLGAAAGCSTSTAQRRVQRLIATGGLRVIATSDVLAAGFGASAMVRMRCGADHADDLAAALSERPEIRFAATLTGSSDCVAEVVLPRIADITAFLATISTDDVRVETEAAPIMRTFTAPFTVFPAEPTPASDSATANARRPHPSDGVAPLQTRATDVERALFDLLVHDGRMPLNDLARALGRTEAATRRTLEDLVQSGRMRIGPLVAPSLLGLGAQLMVWISVAPDSLQSAAAQLAAHPSVHYAAASLGRSNLIGQVFLGDFADVYAFTTDVLGALPGVRDVDVTVQLSTRKRMWSPIADGRFSSPTGPTNTAPTTAPATTAPSTAPATTERTA